MNKIFKKIILQSAILAAAIGMSIIAYHSDKNIWLTLIAGCFIVLFVIIANIENED